MTYFLLGWSLSSRYDLNVITDEDDRPLVFATLKEAQKCAREWETVYFTKIVSLADDDPAHITRAQALRLLGKSTRQLQRWEKGGKLHPFFISGRGNVTYYKREEVEALKQ